MGIGKSNKNKPIDRQAINDFLIANHELIKEKAKHFDELRSVLLEETPKSLRDDINKEYKSEIFSFICEMISRDSGIDTESIWITLEGLDMEEYLK